MLRVPFSNVRIPRSQSTTSALPWATTYSALSSHSSTVLLSPRLRSTGLPASPTASSRLKFCALRVPTWSMSAASATTATSDGVSTSVTTGSPVSSRARRRCSRPSAPSPRKEYGELRGLYAPPRSRLAPAAATLVAVSTSCASLSTAQGPAATRQRAVADAHPADLHHGAFGVPLQADHLVRLADRDGRHDAGKRHHRVADGRRVAAEHADRQPVRAGQLDRLVAAVAHVLHHVGDLRRGRLRAHHDQHVSCSSATRRAPPAGPAAAC